MVPDPWFGPTGKKVDPSVYIFVLKVFVIERWSWAGVSISKQRGTSISMQVV